MFKKAFLFTFILLFISGVTFAATMSVPTGQESYSYNSISDAVTSTDPSQAKPVGVGSITTGGNIISLNIDTEEFSAPVDVYLGIYAPSVDSTNIYIVKSDSTLQTLSQGLVPWKSNTTSSINESPFGNIPTSSLPNGKYYLYLAITPSGNLSNYYLWMTHFEIVEGEVITDTSGESHHFQFETATDNLSLSLQKVYAAYITPLTPENMNEIQTLRHEGIDYLRNHPDEAATALIAEAMYLDPSNKKGLTTIMYFLGYFKSEQGINYLVAQVNRSIAEDCSHGRYHCSDVHVVRTTALKSLGRISALGSALARDKLLDLVNFEDKSIQRLAISLFYDTGGMSRWRAQREMKKHLPVSKLHLLYEIK